MFNYPTMIYVLAYPEFEPACANQICGFRAEHEPERAQLVQPHITLVFGVQIKHLQTITELAETISRKTHAFPITFNTHTIEFDPFEQKYKIFLLCGEGRCALSALHNQLYDGEHRAELSSKHPFRPHMTIATCDGRAEIERVSVAQAGTLPIYGKLCALEIVRLSDGELSKVKTVPFLR